MASREENVKAASRIRYRISIHLGDVIFDEGDIFGDGVNVAARLESLVGPGGIVISETARALIKNQLPVSFMDLGRKNLKNIQDPVRVCRTTLEEQTVHAVPRRRTSRSLAAGLLALMLIAAIATYWVASSTAETELAGTILDEPSIVVVPLESLGGDTDQVLLADGLTEDITTDLSQLPKLFVVARNTASHYAGQNIDRRRITTDLGVGYVLSGSVRQLDDTLRININLVDGQTGEELWARRFDGAVENVLAFQDGVIDAVVAALPLQLQSDEISRSEIGGTENPEAFAAYLIAWDLYKLRTPDAFLSAVDYLEQAISIDPDYGRAYALLASIYYEA